LLTLFVNSRREGLSQRTLEYYRYCLTPYVNRYELSADGINKFLSNLTCGNSKCNYYNAIAVFVRWLIKTGHLKENPLDGVDKPKLAKRLLPSLTEAQVELLINSADNLRDKCIISTFADSGMRLKELLNITIENIDWDIFTITIIGKGNKQRKAPFTQRTASLLQDYLRQNKIKNGNLWDLNRYGVQTMLRRLSELTGIKCNPHSFRRGFACMLHRKGLSTLDIMHLGGWEDLDMVLKYTRSITFEDCLKHYKQVNKSQT
jgi:integrase/recombinase XerC/integrase/recombinase XerD